MTRLLTRPFDSELPRTQRRIAVIVVALGYPLLVLAWVGLPAIGAPPLAWVAIIGMLTVAVLAAAGGLYAYRHAMAQAPDDRLDERQIAVRDRAYLDAYRLFAALVLAGLLAVGILPDLLDRPLSLTFESMQPFFWGAVLASLILPSAIVAWQEPDLRETD